MQALKINLFIGLSIFSNKIEKTSLKKTFVYILEIRTIIILKILPEKVKMYIYKKKLKRRSCINSISDFQ